MTERPRDPESMRSFDSGHPSGPTDPSHPARGPAPLGPTQQGAARQPGLGEGTPEPVPPRGWEAVPRHVVVLAWFLSGLGAVLAFALLLWPFEKLCGLELAFYLGAAGLTVITGVFGALMSWRGRLGSAHSLSLAVIVWGTAVLASELLPRIGYANMARAWLCP